jgi:NAD(P) transhydrogenase subunit beta
MSQGIVTAAYIGASIMFILALGGLSKQETARRGNVFGMLGMLMALLATIIGIVSDNYVVLIGGVIIGGSIGLMLAKKVEMTQMPELVAILHSLVGMAAVSVGFANFMVHDPTIIGTARTIHDVETYLGVLIGALTFSGSVVAFLKLSARISG